MAFVQRSNSKGNRLQKLAPRLTEVGRFFTAGIANTLITIGIYQLLVANLGPLWAYGVAWLAGIMIVAAVYPAMVYRVSTTMPTRVMMAGLYVTLFVLGLLLTRWLNDLGLPARLTIFAVTAVTSGSGYFGGRFILRTKSWI
jgi:putative flippase GtrA